MLVTTLHAAMAIDTLSSATPGLENVAEFGSNRPTGTAVSKTGRVFVTLPYAQYSDNRHTTSVVEVLPDGSMRAFPDKSWNVPAQQRHNTANPGRQFLNVQSASIDADEQLWVLDTGSPKRAGVVPGGAKLVRIDLKTNRVSEVIPFRPETYQTKTYFNDVRVDSRRGFAYVTDTGTTGLVVVNLRTGAQRRVLTTGCWLTVDPKGPTVEGVTAPAKLREQLPRSADGLALDANGDWLYLAPLPYLGKHIYRVPTTLLRTFAVQDKQIEQAVERVAKAVFADGIEIGRDGALYLTDLEANGITRLLPSGQLKPVVRDPRLSWPDTIAFNSNGALYIPVAQFHTLPTLNNGVDRRHEPFRLYRFAVSLAQPRVPNSQQRLNSPAPTAVRHQARFDQPVSPTVSGGTK
jgi:sugar lactone lactonase YvrE